MSRVRRAARLGAVWHSSRVIWIHTVARRWTGLSRETPPRPLRRHVAVEPMCLELFVTSWQRLVIILYSKFRGRFVIGVRAGRQEKAERVLIKLPFTFSLYFRRLRSSIIGIGVFLNMSPAYSVLSDIKASYASLDCDSTLPDHRAGTYNFLSSRWKATTIPLQARN